MLPKDCWSRRECCHLINIIIDIDIYNFDPRFFIEYPCFGHTYFIIDWTDPPVVDLEPLAMENSIIDDINVAFINEATTKAILMRMMLATKLIQKF